MAIALSAVLLHLGPASCEVLWYFFPFCGDHEYRMQLLPELELEDFDLVLSAIIPPFFAS